MRSPRGPPKQPLGKTAQIYSFCVRPGFFTPLFRHYSPIAQSIDHPALKYGWGAKLPRYDPHLAGKLRCFG